jgi:hypothetical protein
MINGKLSGVELAHRRTEHNKSEPSLMSMA